MPIESSSEEKTQKAKESLRGMLVALLRGEIRRATLARSEAAEEFLLLTADEQKILRFWLGNGHLRRGAGRLFSACWKHASPGRE